MTKERPVVIVEWRDAWEKEGTHEISELKAVPLTTYTAGFLIQEDEDGVLLASDWWPEDTGHVRNAMYIPRTMIVDIHQVH